MGKKLLTYLSVILMALFFASPVYADDSETPYRSSNKCSMADMQDMYLKDGNADKYCWYCKVVVVLTNAYLQAARQGLEVTTQLGKICAKIGFMLWLAFYILTQVSSLAPIKLGEMLQEILVMGFKVSLVYICLKETSVCVNVISTYFINPIVELGIEYGSALLDGLMPSDATLSDLVNT